MNKQYILKLSLAQLLELQSTLETSIKQYESAIDTWNNDKSIVNGLENGKELLQDIEQQIKTLLDE